MGLEEVTSVLSSHRLRFHGHVARALGCIHSAADLVIPGIRGRDRPCKTLRECVKKNILECGLSDTDPMDRAVWKAGVQASRLLPTPVTGNVAAV